jgi:hypothetical protein
LLLVASDQPLRWNCFPSEIILALAFLISLFGDTLVVARFFVFFGAVSFAVFFMINPHSFLKELMFNLMDRHKKSKEMMMK